MCICIHIYIHTRMYTQMLCADGRGDMVDRVSVAVPQQFILFLCIYMSKDIYKHTYMYLFMFTYIFVRIHIYIHTHMYIQMLCADNRGDMVVRVSIAVPRHFIPFVDTSQIEAVFPHGHISVHIQEGGGNSITILIFFVRRLSVLVYADVCIYADFKFLVCVCICVNVKVFPHVYLYIYIQ